MLGVKFEYHRFLRFECVWPSLKVRPERGSPFPYLQPGVWRSSWGVLGKGCSSLEFVRSSG